MLCIAILCLHSNVSYLFLFCMMLNIAEQQDLVINAAGGRHQFLSMTFLCVSMSYAAATV